MSDSAEHDRQVAAAIHDAGWRTGCACLPASLEWHRRWMPVSVQRQIAGTTDAFWVPYVASQACDLVHGKLDEEPHVEFILGRLDMPEEPGIALKKSYRRLQLRHPSKPFAEFRVHDRWLVERAALVSLQRSKDLDLLWEQGIDLAKWLGGRYARYPLPNQLAARMQFNAGRQREWLKALTNEIEEIRTVVTPPDTELAPDETYNVVLYLVAKHAALQSEKAKKAFDSFKAWMLSLDGVTAQVILTSADQFTYATFKQTHRLDLDAMTFGYLSGPKGAIPVGE